MKCPRCQNQLKNDKMTYYTTAGKENEVVIDICDTCEGIWFDKGELELIESVVKPEIIELRSIPKESYQNKKLNCPKCSTKEEMEKVKNERDKKVIMDICPKCKGVWIDKNEMNAIQTESVLSMMVKVIRWTFT